jgi:serine/threonine protein kinase
VHRDLKPSNIFLQEATPPGIGVTQVKEDLTHLNVVKVWFSLSISSATLTLTLSVQFSQLSLSLSFQLTLTLALSLTHSLTHSCIYVTPGIMIVF